MRGLGNKAAGRRAPGRVRLDTGRAGRPVLDVRAGVRGRAVPLVQPHGQVFEDDAGHEAQGQGGIHVRLLAHLRAVLLPEIHIMQKNTSMLEGRSGLL